jgi:hypothetical protein
VMLAFLEWLQLLNENQANRHRWNSEETSHISPITHSVPLERALCWPETQCGAPHFVNRRCKKGQTKDAKKMPATAKRKWPTTVSSSRPVHNAAKTLL